MNEIYDSCPELMYDEDYTGPSRHTRYIDPHLWDSLSDEERENIFAN